MTIIGWLGYAPGLTLTVLLTNSRYNLTPHANMRWNTLTPLVALCHLLARSWEHRREENALGCNIWTGYASRRSTHFRDLRQLSRIHFCRTNPISSKHAGTKNRCYDCCNVMWMLDADLVVFVFSELAQSWCSFYFARVIHIWPCFFFFFLPQSNKNKAGIKHQNPHAGTWMQDYTRTMQILSQLCDPLLVLDSAIEFNIGRIKFFFL